MGSSSTSVVYSNLIHLGVCLTFFVVFLAGIGRFIADPKDRSRCQSALNDGWWQDTDTFTKWQPSGCMMHQYKPAEISACLSHSRILYVGDSIAREQFFSFARIMRKDVETDGPRHVDRKYEFSDDDQQQLTLEFWWDPYLNSSRTIDMLKTNEPSIRPSLLVIGSGVWYMRYRGDAYLEEWRDAMDRVFDAVQRSSRVADVVLLSPVEMPEFDLLSEERARTMSLDKVNAMNAYLKSNAASINALTPFAVPFAWNLMASSTENLTEDGLHFETPVTTTQVQLALNYRCNDHLPKHFPMDSTCCFHYPVPKWYQSIFFLFFLAAVPAGLYMSGSQQPLLNGLRRLIPAESTLNALFIFGLGVVYMFFGDRTQIFAKAQKYFDPLVFTALFVGSMVAGIVTMKTKTDGDLGFLNRDQTDEWKGWMQIVILIYHFMGASSISGIYNPIRVLVAAYLFQTGYGHFFFFYKKGDFSLGRVLNVLVRLNLLTFVLQYVMDTNYLSYYFTPLVSFWFGVIWITMYIGHQSNKTMPPWFMLCKIGIAAVVTTMIIHVPGLLERMFALLERTCNIHWDAAEWRFRLGLDAWIVYVGMLCAYGAIKFSEHRLQEHPSWSTAKKAAVIGSVVAMIGYFYFELSCSSKIVYNRYHPYISWIPIFAFITLRNATVRLRNTSSKFFIFFGRISLETFIGQFHMWLAGDTKGLLVVVTHPRAAHGLGWWFNFAVSSVLFVFVCYYLSQATGQLTKWICSGVLSAPASAASSHGRSGHQEYQAVPLLPTNSQQTRQETGHQTAKSDAFADPPTAVQGDIVEQQEEDMESGPPASRLSAADKFKNFCNDARVKVCFFIIIVAIVNNFCN